MIVGEQGILTEAVDGAVWLYRDGQRSRLIIDQPDTTVAKAFVDTILSGQENLSPGHEGAYGVEVIEAVYRSVAERRVIQIERRQSETIST